ncbi:Speract receptor [Hypsibius exemplaris]|uniref:Multifunctional fusion protein n=1 Tax=Hypsibius exemplaris TaxID=2072580 RepID=A0A1W0XEQ2_HYPEX|nr:Speract receptor [Hypsibius exemplaris]
MLLLLLLLCAVGSLSGQRARIPQRWENDIVPFKISEKFTPAELKSILEILPVFDEKTCVRFKPYKGETSYLQISLGTQCQSSIGRVGGAQLLTLGRSCLSKRSIMRELMHALGFQDEHLRADRDSFVTINYNNIKSSDRIFFQSLSDAELPRFNQPYDFDSVLQVPSNWKVDPAAKSGYISGSRRDRETYYDRPGYQISGAISLAVNQINHHHPDRLLEGHQLEFEYAETYGNEDESIKHTARFSLGNISAIIGPQETCYHEARIAASFRTLMLSYFCQETLKDSPKDHTDRKQPFTFVNVKPPAEQISKALVSLLHEYGWKKITFIYNNETESRERTAESIKVILQMHKIEVLQTKPFRGPYYVGFEEDDVILSPFAQIIRETKDHTRIYVVVGDIDTMVGFMNSMEEEKLLDMGDYFVVGVYQDQYKPEDPAKYLRGVFEQGVSKTAIKAFRSFVAVIPTPPKDAKLREFNNLVNEWLPKPPFNFSWDDRLQKTVRVEAAYLHDAVFLYAGALHECLKNTTDCPNPHDGFKLVKYILDKPYISAMGYGGYIDANGIAQGNYSLLALKGNPNDHNWNVGLADIGIFLLSVNRSELPGLVLKPQEQVRWPGDKVPLDEPVCGFDNLKCAAKDNSLRNVILAVVFVFLLGLCAILFFYGRHCKYEKKLDSVIWKLEWKELLVADFMAFLRYNADPDFDLEDSPVNATIIAAIDIADVRMTTVNTEVGIYRRHPVAIKRVKKRHLDLTREVKKELLMMKELRHDNLCSFIGACVDPICIVTDFCERGSLRDILYAENFALDDAFVKSLVGDLIKGMIFIHASQNLGSHGNLKTSNCLVDSRFVLKITDYGLHEFKKKTEHSTHRKIDDSVFNKCLWTAPELLRAENPPPGGSKSGDVYSFAIVLFEVYGRSGPFGKTDMSARDIVRELRYSTRAEPFRPPIHTLDISVPEYVVTLMEECWSENPDSRPQFPVVRSRFPTQDGNIMDDIQSRLQRYSNHLETLVGERTCQLEVEKKKTETLLFEILPRPVAEHLIKAEKVEAEQFECVTIFFSDIVGFTALSSESTPFEVVNFLNDLYTLFDSLLEHYDAYKVETIGDSYMVCSGLPIRNGDRHAGVIASMALHLLDAIKTFRIRHRPQQQLLLRIGVHSGPVVAGVVGLKMPRYCLFGDTVNTASRFESTGEALRIHCSPQSKKILDDLGGYFLEPRGLVQMKGKGEQLTYWLTDEDESIKLQRQQQKLSSFSDINRASPSIIAKWGSQNYPKRRLSCIRQRASPTASPCLSRQKLNSESTFGCETIQEDCNGHIKGSLPNILKSMNNLTNQYVLFNGGESSRPLLYEQDYIPAETRSAGPASRSGSYEMLNLPDRPILVT